MNMPMKHILNNAREDKMNEINIFTYSAQKKK